MTPTPAGRDVEVAGQQALDRHERRRQAGTPTVSVVVGPAGQALQLVASWARARGRVAAVATGGHPADGDDTLVAWLRALRRHRDLRRESLLWLDRRAGDPPGTHARSYPRLTSYQREQLLETLAPRGAISYVDAQAYHRAVFAAEFEVDPISLLDRLRQELDRERTDDGAIVALVGRGIPPGEAPALVLVAPESGLDGWIAATGRWLGVVLGRAPWLSTIVVASEAAHEAMGRVDPSTRRGLLFGEQVVRLETTTSEALRRTLGMDEPQAGALDGTLRRLAADGAGSSLVELLREASTAVRAAAETLPSRLDPALADRARSAAERFLFERLETLPATAGRFVLNARLDHRFGPTPMEIDLLAPEARLAVEVDGYHHFRDADDYRRDRRKDVALQQAGYVVVRLLAADVVERLEDVLDTITRALAARPSVRTRSSLAEDRP